MKNKENNINYKIDDKKLVDWHIIKNNLRKNDKRIYFHEREVWWCSTGENVGFEANGKGRGFSRPVVVLKKFNLDVCIIVPLTTVKKHNRYYFSIGEIEKSKESFAVLSQIRLIDVKRFIIKIGVVDKKVFNELNNSIIDILKIE